MQKTRLNSWDGKMPWRRKWQPTPVFLLGESQDSGAWQVTVLGIARVGQDLATKPPIHTEFLWEFCLEGLVFAKWLCLVSGQLARLRHKFLSFKGRRAKCFDNSGILIIIMPFTCCVTLGNLPLCTSVSLSQPNSYECHAGEYEFKAIGSHGKYMREGVVWFDPVMWFRRSSRSWSWLQGHNSEHEFLVGGW